MYRNNNDVVLIANAKHVDAIKKHGLELHTPYEQYMLDIPAYDNISKIKPFKKDDVIFLTMKSQHVLRSLGHLKNSGAAQDIPIFCFQNGLFTEPLASRIFSNIYGAVLSMAGIFLEPGVVYDSVEDGRCFFEIGSYPLGLDCTAEKVADSLINSGFAGGSNAEVMKAKAAKCLLSLGHALLAITDGKGDLKYFLEKLRDEARIVWKSAGIEWEHLETFISRTDKLRGARVKNEKFQDKSTTSSSWQSLFKETGSIEAMYINGDVVNLGRLLNIETPFNKVVSEVAQEMAVKGEKPGKYTVQDLINKMN